MGHREGVLAAVLLIVAGCGKSERRQEPQWWYLKPGQYIVDQARADEGALPESEGWRTIGWRIGTGDPLRFTIEWSDARGDAMIARIAGRIDAAKETRLQVSVREAPPRSQALSFSCPHCATRWQSIGGGADAGARCPTCRKTLEQDSPWHRLATRELRIRAVPPIAELEAEPSFRRDGDALVRDLDRRLVPVYGADFDIAPYLLPDQDGRIDRAVPGDIAFIFHLPPGDLGESWASRLGPEASYACECGNIRIEGDQSGYEIAREGRPIPLDRYPLPVWRFAFRIDG